MDAGNSNFKLRPSSFDTSVVTENQASINENSHTRRDKMNKIVDARGLSCPQPVLLALNEMKKMNKGEIAILVDTDTSKENVSRAATTRGWRVEVEKDQEEYRLLLKKD